MTLLAVAGHSKSSHPIWIVTEPGRAIKLPGLLRGQRESPMPDFIIADKAFMAGYRAGFRKGYAEGFDDGFDEGFDACDQWPVDATQPPPQTEEV